MYAFLMNEPRLEIPSLFIAFYELKFILFDRTKSCMEQARSLPCTKLVFVSSSQFFGHVTTTKREEDTRAPETLK